jgi:hypothetical protein
MNALATSQFHSVIPAKAGTHGKPQQAFNQSKNTSLSTSPIPIHAERDAAYVGPSLRRDDGCGEVGQGISRTARRRIGAALVAALLSANPALADSPSVCISATNLLKIAEPSWRPINNVESGLLKGYVSDRSLKAAEIVAFDVDDAFVFFHGTNLNKPTQQATTSTTLFVQPANQNRIVEIKFSTLTFNPGDVVRGCINALDNDCQTESWSFETQWNSYNFGLSRNLNRNREVDKFLESSGLGSGCDPTDAPEQLKFWTTFLAKPPTAKPTP